MLLVCCTGFLRTGQVVAQIAGPDIFWSGAISPSWAVEDNWDAGFIPEFNETAVVNTAIDPVGLARMSGSISSFGNLGVEGGGTVDVLPGSTADVKGAIRLGNSDGDGTLNPTGGEVTFSSDGSGQGLYLGT